nr:hypothetical protein [Vibrio splendidus]MCC4882948.1 hypothetical protein [Vibrio splendidus]
MQPVFNEQLIPYPSQLDDVIPDHQISDKTISSIRAINQVVVIDIEDDYMMIKDGGAAYQVIKYSMLQIMSDEPAAITLHVIEMFHLDSYMSLDAEIAELTEKAISQGHKPKFDARGGVAFSTANY